jgi:predicted dehydrogenase
VTVIRFGVLGTGFWADVCHASGLAAHPDVELVGVWGRDPAKTSALAGRHGVEAEADLDALLAKVDAVSLAVPPDVQAELASRAARAGCHVLLEKPLALATDSAERVVDEIARAGVGSVVFFLQRFVEPVEAWLRESVAPREWDGGSATFLASSLMPHSPFSQSPWRHEHGALWDLAPHLLAVLIPALGPVGKVTAARGSRESVDIVLQHEGGASSEISASMTAPEATGGARLELWGPGGRTQAPLASDFETPYARAVSALVSTIDTGRPHPCTAAFGAEVVRVLAAAQRLMARAPVSA